MRSELEQQLARAEGQLVSASAAASAAEQTQRRLKSEVSQLSERLEGDAGKGGEAVPHAGSAEQLDTAEGARQAASAAHAIALSDLTHEKDEAAAYARGLQEETSLLAERVKVCGPPVAGMRLCMSTVYVCPVLLQVTDL